MGVLFEEPPPGANEVDQPLGDVAELPRPNEHLTGVEPGEPRVVHVPQFGGELIDPDAHRVEVGGGLQELRTELPEDTADEDGVAVPVPVGVAGGSGIGSPGPYRRLPAPASMPSGRVRDTAVTQEG